PVIVNSLFLKKPERIEALGLILLLALLLWRLMERAMRTHIDTTNTPLPGWDKKATERIGRINGIFTPPPGRTPLMFAGDHCWRRPLHAPPARRGSPLERPAPPYHAAWTGRAGWGRLQPQGCPRARASGRAGGRMTQGWHRRTRARYGAATRTAPMGRRHGSWASSNGTSSWRQRAGAMGGG